MWRSFPIPLSALFAGLLTAFAGGLAALPAGAVSPIAEVVCEPSPRMTQRLKRQQGATLASTGLRGPEEVIELWLDPRDNWTMVIAYASGTSCIVAMGAHWSRMQPQDPA
ncbi:hypothetical protein PVT71_17385 [Salipiger sp. H15]|uniref:PepSY domain-containing protein n=1 Tax=Alloyangia sp. H15 TaxID=3029062 RepID=A0AAU8AN60_9RHOB